MKQLILLVALLPTIGFSQQINGVFGTASSNQILHIQGEGLMNAKVHICFYIWCLSQQQNVFADDGGTLTLNMGLGNPTILDLMVRPVSEEESSWWVIKKESDLIYPLTDVFLPNSTKLYWEAPTKTITGTPVTISTYRLRYADKNILINPTIRDIVLPNLIPIDTTFTLTAIDNLGNESDPIAITKTFQ